MSNIPGLTSVIKQGITDNLSNGVRQATRSAQHVVDAIQEPSSFMSNIRSRNLPVGGEPTIRTLTNATVVSQGAKDWRVSLSVPAISGFSGPLLDPLVTTGNKMIFPYTPTVLMSHTASYNTTSATHTNYAFHSYVSSQVDQLMITGEFTVENQEEASYWLAVIHYLRSVTKMFYGGDSNAGAPPPIVKLNGYGDYVFNNIPVVISNFTVDLQQDVDYIAASVGGDPTSLQNGDSTTYVPARSSISITVMPIYSRSSIEQFSLSDFVSGKYVSNGKGFI